jgi:ATP-dependent protease ClpP protease subunit
LEIQIEKSFITMTGEIVPPKGRCTSSDTKKLSNCLSKFRKDNLITVRLKTPGGCNPTAKELSRLIVAYPNARCLADTCVASAGIFFLLSFPSANRFARKGTKFKFHYPSFNVGTPAYKKMRTLEGIQEWISFRTGLSIQEVDELMREEKELNTKEAISSGLISQVK